MKRKSDSAVQKPPDKKDTCSHHWIIETPTGPVSMGICKHCGEMREFPNYFGSFLWEDEISALSQLASIKSSSSELTFDDE